MNLHDVESLARALMAEHGLNRAGWTFAFDDAKQRLGFCNYQKKRISLSRNYARAADAAHVTDTLLHEIAHVFAPGDNHGLRWKAVAVRLGATPQSCADNPFVTSAEENARRLSAVEGQPYVRVAKERVRGKRYRVLRENNATIVLVDEHGGEVRASRSLVYPDGEPEPTMTQQLDIERNRRLDAVAGKPLYQVAGSAADRKYAILRRGRVRTTMVNIATGATRQVETQHLIPVQETGPQKLGRMLLPRR